MKKMDAVLRIILACACGGVEMRCSGDGAASEEVRPWCTSCRGEAERCEVLRFDEEAAWVTGRAGAGAERLLIRYESCEVRRGTRLYQRVEAVCARRGEDWIACLRTLYDVRLRGWWGDYDVVVERKEAKAVR